MHRLEEGGGGVREIREGWEMFNIIFIFSLKISSGVVLKNDLPGSAAF